MYKKTQLINTYTYACKAQNISLDLFKKTIITLIFSKASTTLIQNNYPFDFEGVMLSESSNANQLKIIE